LLKHTGITDPDFQAQMDRDKWPKLKEKLSQIFKTKTRDEWCDIMLGTDVCFAPVLSLNEVVDHPHNAERQTFVEIDGVTQPSPSPRFSRTKQGIQGPPPAPGEHTEPVLEDWGFSSDEIENLKTSGAV
jgi:alpha-methylacyl-CoA racemase